MWLRNVVCSVVTIAVLWAIGQGWHSVGTTLGADRSFGGLAIFLALVFIFGACCYLIARAVDARAERQRGPMGPGQ